MQAKAELAAEKKAQEREQYRQKKEQQRLKEERLKCEEEARARAAAPTPSHGLLKLVLSNVPLMVLIAAMGQLNPNSLLMGACHLLGALVSTSIVWPLEDACQYRNAIAVAWEARQPRVRGGAAVRHPLWDMNLRDLLRSRWSGEYVKLTGGALMRFVVMSFLQQAPIYLFCAFVFSTCAMVVRRGLLLYCLHHLGHGIHSEPLPVVLMYIFTLMPAMALLGVLSAPLWTLHQHYVRRHLMYGLESKEALMADEPEERDKKSKKGRERRQSDPKPEGDKAEPSLLEAVGVSWSAAYHTCGTTCAFAMRAGIAFIAFDMSTGILIGWKSRKGLLWGALFGALAQMIAVLAAYPFDPAVRNALSTRLAVVALGGAIRFGLVHMIKVLVIPLQICTVFKCFEVTPEEMFEKWGHAPDCGSTCSWSDLIFGPEQPGL